MTVQILFTSEIASKVYWDKSENQLLNGVFEDVVERPFSTFRLIEEGEA
ncbi:hypothetical protein [Rummeliibacillus pycnus]